MSEDEFSIGETLALFGEAEPIVVERSHQSGCACRNCIAHRERVLGTENWREAYDWRELG